MLRFVSVLFALMLTAGQTNARLPGFKARVTNNGIGYANTVAHTLLAQELKTIKIPNQSGDNSDIKWTLTNIQNRGCTPPSSIMTLTPGENGLTWSISNLGIHLYADWWAEFHKAFIKISHSGSADISVKGVDLKVTIKLGDNGKGRPLITMMSCNADVSDVDIDFHGSIAFILNVFNGIIGDKIRDVMKDEICSVVKTLINDDGAAAMNKLKVTVTLFDKFVLDFGITQAPTVLAKYLEAYDKGEVYWINNTSVEAPFSPDAFPPLTNDYSRMLYLWMSEYTANTAAYVAQKHGFLQYNLTAADLPAANRSYFNTTCKIACVGKLIPQIGKMYPNSTVEMRGVSTSAPNASISKTRITVDTKCIVNMFAHTQDGKTPFLLSLAVNLSMSVKVAVVNERVTGKIVDSSFKVEVLKSAVGTVYSEVLNLILDGALTLVFIPELNKMGAKGVDLPVTDYLKFDNTSVTLLNGSFVISTDIQYTNKISQALTFRSEYSIHNQQ